MEAAAAAAMEAAAVEAAAAMKTAAAAVEAAAAGEGRSRNSHQGDPEHNRHDPTHGSEPPYVDL